MTACAITLRRAAPLLLAVLCLAFASAAALAEPASAGRFCEQLRGDLRAGAGQGSLAVRDLESGRTLCDYAAKRRQILASNTKLFTTATALIRLRPRTRLPTTVWRTGRLRPNGTLVGDIYLKGSGDPALAMPAYAKLRRPRVATNLLAVRGRIRRAGIRHITGRIYADDTIFDRRRGVPDSGWGTSPWIGPLSGLGVNSGFTGPGARYFAVDPAILAAEKLTRSLRGAGITIRKAPRLGRLPARGQRERIAWTRSPPVSLLAEQTNVHSDNYFAETLLKLIGARVLGRGSTVAGARVVMRDARVLGSGIAAVDGSGLSRGNRASAREVVDLLAAMSERPIGKAYRSTLPLAGRDGTLAGRLQGTAANRRCEAKTGTLTGASALSGYCTTRSGREIAFSILMNSVGSSSTARRHQDSIAARIAGL